MLLLLLLLFLIQTSTWGDRFPLPDFLWIEASQVKPICDFGSSHKALGVQTVGWTLWVWRGCMKAGKPQEEEQMDSRTLICPLQPVWPCTVSRSVQSEQQLHTVLLCPEEGLCPK